MIVKTKNVNKLLNQVKYTNFLLCSWVDCVEKHGSKNLSLLQILMPAIKLAEDGFKVGKITQNAWKSESEKLSAAKNKHGCDLLVRGFILLSLVSAWFFENALIW